jgi:hypothetical protein
MDTIRTELGLEWPQWEGMGMWMGMKVWKWMGMKKGNGEHKRLGMYSWNAN